MGFDDFPQEQSSSPKLSLFSFPVNRAIEHPGTVTPPVNAAVSVPFQWEEAPGKPRPCETESDPKGFRRCLELPPRLLLPSEGAKITNSPSPTTVLDGPDVGRYPSTAVRSVSLREGGPLLNEKGFGSSRRWGGSRKSREVLEGKIDFSSSKGGDEGGHGPKARITRVRRRGSFSSFSQNKSRLWASIYEGLKHVIPWSRRQEKQGRMNSSIAG